MNRLLQPFWISFIGCLLVISCKKEKDCDGCTTPPPVIKPNMAPVAYAGLDQTINLPKDSVTLYGSASYDPDGKIKKWKWTKISGPSSFQLMNADSMLARVITMDTGIYQFELIVTDSLGLTDKDTVKISVLPKIITINTEIVFNDLVWDCWWGCWVTVPNIFNYIPQGAQIQVFIRRDGSTNWVQATSTPPTGFGYGFSFDVGNLVVYGSEASLPETDTPDVKVIY